MYVQTRPRCQQCQCQQQLAGIRGGAGGAEYIFAGLAVIEAIVMVWLATRK